MSRATLGRAAIVAALTVASGCESSVCRGVDGTCVALTVAGRGTIDGVEILLSGAATGTKIAPREAKQQSLPVEVALQLPAAATGALHVGVVGVDLGRVVGSGSADTAVKPGAHTAVTVTLTSDGSPGGGDGGGIALPFDVNGVRIKHYILGDGAVVDVPTDFTGAAISALLPTDGGVQVVAGSGDANGNFTIHNVSAPYYLKYSGNYVYGGAMHPDLGVWILGRPDQTAATATTTLQIAATNLAAWAAGDALQLFSMNAGLAYFGLQSVVVPATGATTLNGSLDLSTAMYGNLVDAAKGDDMFLSQLVADSDSGVPFQRLGKLGTFPPFTIANGGNQAVSTTMNDVPTTAMLPVNWTRSQFAALGVAVNPKAVADFDTVDLFAQPGGLAHGWVGSTPDLAIATPPTGTSDVALTMRYGNPFPSSWALVLAAGKNFSMSYTASGATPAQLDGAIYAFAPVAGTPTPIVPVIGPVQAPTIDGMDAFTAQLGASASPLVSWMPPAIGTPSSYTVSVYGIFNRGGKTVLENEATIYTALTSVLVPPGLLAGGTSYFVQITAYADTIDRGVTPFSAALPMAYADVLTAPLTVGTVALGTSCKDILAAHPGMPDGVYTIDVDGAGAAPPVAVYCDMTTAGGGWTLCAWSKDATAETVGWAPAATARSSNWYACHQYSVSAVDAMVRVSGASGAYVPRFSSVDFRSSVAETSYTSTTASPTLALTISPNNAACGAVSTGNFQWTVAGTPGEVLFAQQPRCTCTSGCQAKDFFSFVRSAGVNSNGCSGANQIPPEMGFPCGSYGDLGLHMELWAR